MSSTVATSFEGPSAPVAAAGRHHYRSALTLLVTQPLRRALTMGFDHLLRPLDELSGGLLSRAAGHVMRQITAVTQYHDCMAPFWEVVAVSIFGLVFAIMLLTCYAMLGYQLVLLGFKWLAWVIRSLCTVATGLMIFYILAPFAQLLSQIPAPRSVR